MAAPQNSDVKNRILTATKEMLRTRSFEEISLKEIAKNSEISKGTLYYYYNNKDDIIFDVADIYLQELAQNLVEWADNSQKDTSLPRLLNYVFVRGIYNESGNLRLYLVGAAVSGHEALRKRLREKYIYFKSELAQRLSLRGCDGEYTAWLILTIMDGVLIQSCLGNESFDSEAFIHKTAKLLVVKEGEHKL